MRLWRPAHTLKTKMDAYKLHPLVLINVSDHHTRFAAQLGEGEVLGERVMGCLLGFQTGTREVEICISFEVATKVDPDTNHLGFDQQYLTDQIVRYKQNFPKFEIVGWYATGDKVDPNLDIPIHKSLEHLHESPVFLLFNPTHGAVNDTDATMESSPSTSKKQKELPVTLWEPVMKSSTNINSELQFIETTYRVETTEAERVAVDHVSRASGRNESSTGALNNHISGVVRAIEMLDVRLEVLVKYLNDVKNGVVEPDHEVLRAAAAAMAQARRLPGNSDSSNRNHFQKEMNKELDDASATHFLGTITKAAADFESFATRFNVVHDKRRF